VRPKGATFVNANGGRTGLWGELWGVANYGKLSREAGNSRNDGPFNRIGKSSKGAIHDDFSILSLVRLPIPPLSQTVGSSLLALNQAGKMIAAEVAHCLTPGLADFLCVLRDPSAFSAVKCCSAANRADNPARNANPRPSRISLFVRNYASAAPAPRGRLILAPGRDYGTGPALGPASQPTALRSASDR